ncbi:hypothetical protein Poli38472_007284 [Pythium oligandrum]|uniref:Programmed cell death protein 5 n=1 Tax=Pythium oligandrum TaxID=41045 RepID=A0A8K1C9E8_PYTOL|nr:hypothetical protein Poli38472_007284 [Pythium oligandrum]|eukprot:TMW59139.1 hypothetical protein Poli38472_007284 [Pythium oligandrum]
MAEMTACLGGKAALTGKRATIMSSNQKSVPMTPEQMQAEQMKQKQNEEMRSSLLQQVLQPEARERLSRVAIVKPEKARAIEDMVLQMAQRGQLTAKIDEDRLIDLLNRAGETEEKQRTKVTMKRRTYFSDEDEDDDDDF